jgi:hypothetical protein
MTAEETWVAEQARLIDLEEGFGPRYRPHPKEPAPEADPELAA